MEYILLILIILFIIINIVISNDSGSVLVGSLCGVILGIMLILIMINTDKICENGVKEYLTHPEKYNIEVKYTKDLDGFYVPCDTIVTKLK